jgi:hypothetical protein
MTGCCADIAGVTCGWAGMIAWWQRLLRGYTEGSRRWPSMTRPHPAWFPPGPGIHRPARRDHRKPGGPGRTRRRESAGARRAPASRWPFSCAGDLDRRRHRRAAAQHRRAESPAVLLRRAACGAGADPRPARGVEQDVGRARAGAAEPGPQTGRRDVTPAPRHRRAHCRQVSWHRPVPARGRLPGGNISASSSPARHPMTGSGARAPGWSCCGDAAATLQADFSRARKRAIRTAS